MKRSPKYLFLLICILSSCSSTKYVPEGSYLLDEVKIETDTDIKPSLLDPYIRQNPNSKWFSLIKTQLYIYNLSGQDSTRWSNRFLRKIGNAPVIYNEELAKRASDEIAKAVRNMGYMGATVETKTAAKNKKIKLTYSVDAGHPYILRSIKREINDSVISRYLENDSIHSLLKPDMLFDVNVLNEERERITKRLIQRGYYKFNKDFITYVADTARNTYHVDLTLQLLPYRQSPKEPFTLHQKYKINSVNVLTDYDLLYASSLDERHTVMNDSLNYRETTFFYRNKMYLRPKVLTNNIHFRVNDYYNSRSIQQTNNSLGRLSALKYANIRFVERNSNDSVPLLDAYILLTKSKSQSVSFEVEGTNSAGDLGMAASVGYQHRNLFRGSENFSIKFRGAYEVVSGLGQGYRNNNYIEAGAEANIVFPRFLFPFLSSNFKRKIRTTTEFGLQYNYQSRPEFDRMVASASWAYRWTANPFVSHRIDLIDVSYLYMPWISSTFKELYEGKKNYILEYNYKNRLIVRMGYNYNYNSIGSNLINNTIAVNSYSFKFGVESAGNLLYAVSKVANAPKNSDGEYELLKIPFAQYIKANVDFAKNIMLDERNSLAFHLGFGIAVPYGNASVIPFEKRYFSGGANSVRGWSIRSLGPGSFAGDDNFLNQSGDIKIDASIELRSKLFWKLQGALFADAGNIWTLHNYSEEQPGGQFQFNRFYKEIAIAYGLGLRFDLDFFVIRVDGGMKALNPVYKSGKERYPIITPKFSRDFALHFAVGYPF